MTETVKVGKNLKIDVTKELESIESCLNEAKVWDDLYNQELSNNKSTIVDLSTLIINAENILISSTAMHECVDAIYNYRITELKIDFYLANQTSLTTIQLNDIDELLRTKLIFTDNIIENKINLIKNFKENIEKTINDINNTLKIENDIQKLNNLKKK